MSSYRRIIYLISIMVAVGLATTGVTIFLLYETALEARRGDLVETVQSQARLMEAVARFDRIYSQDYPGGALEATISQIRDAHENYKGHGETGEFTLARREGDQIVFLMRHRHRELSEPKPIPFRSNLAEPMQRALSGESGTMIGRDYRGVEVLAAYEPVRVLDLGIVAKVDMAEVREPFLLAGGIAAAIALAIIVAGAVVFLRLAHPMVVQLRESARRFRATFEQAAVGIAHTASDGRFLRVNEKLCDIVGYGREELLGLTFQAITHPDDLEEDLRETDRLLAGEISVLKLEKRYVRKDGSIVWGNLTATLARDGSGDPQYFIAVVEDITARKRAEEARRESEERLSAIADNLPGTIFRRITHADGSVSYPYISTRYMEYLGLPATEVMADADRLVQATHAEDRQAYLDAYAAATRDLSPLDAERRIITPSGEVKWFRTMARPHRLANGDVVFDGISLNVTDQKQAEEARRESEERLRAIADNLPGAIFRRINHADGSVSYPYVSARVEELLGITPEEVRDDPERLIQMTHPDDLQGFLDAYAKAARDLTPLDVARREITTSGEVRWLRSMARPHRLDNGDVVFDGIAVDITEQRQTEEALLESEARLRALVDNAPYAIYLKDRERRFTLVNPRICERHQAKPEDLLGKKLEDFLDSDVASPFAEHDREVMRLRETVEREMSYRRKDGEVEELIQTKFPILDEDGELIGTGGIDTDITARKVVEAARERLEAQLRRSQKMEVVGTFASGIAHDFNNILTGLTGYSHLAFDALPEDSEVRRDIRQIMQGIDRATNLIQQILTFSRLGEEGRRPIDIHTVVEEVLEFLRASLPTSIEIRPRLDRDAGTVLADPTQIHQVLMNLFGNAADAIGEAQGVIEVGLRGVDLDAAAAPPDGAPGRYVELVVRDTGHGMDAVTAERAFDPFFTTKDVGQGTGLGLAAVHGIISGHGGTVRVESKPGRGTTFTILLPRIEAAAQSSPAPVEAMPGGRERVLLVDDEAGVLRSHARALRRLGYRVKGAVSGRAALDAFRAAPGDFDIVVTDHAMPELTGAALAAKIVKLRPDVPVILCSGLPRAAAESTGVREFLLKPFSLASLARTIRRVLDQGTNAEAKNESTRVDE